MLGFSKHPIRIRLFMAGIILLLTSSLVFSQSGVTSPKQQFGFQIGADFQLVTYTQLTEYWRILARESDRMTLREIGKTEEGRTMVMAIITSPGNHADLEKYRSIACSLAKAENLDDETAQKLAEEGKAVIWIDGGLHATEVVGAQQELELVWQMVSRDDPETLRILDNVILLATITNPDGMEVVGNWYMREKEQEKRSTRNLPFLYQKYAGHDNNRDFYMVTQKESEAVCRVLYQEWFPQVIYNHHQSGPAGCVIFVPPFREPHSYHFDPLLVLGITTVGNAMHSRFAREGKPGAAMRDIAGYQTWWNGCLRCTPYFHNMIGILTEIIGNPTPMEVPFILERHLPQGDYPFAVPPQVWHFRQSIDYSQTANRAILDLAAKLRQDFLFNIYRMGKNSIERGTRDNWTITPKLIEEARKTLSQENVEMTGSGRSRGYPLNYFEKALHQPEYRDPRGYILPANQADFSTAGKFINTLIKNGVTVHRAVQSFQVNGKTYPEGSLVVKTAQAFRPHIIDMFEPQYYPDESTSSGEAPRPPYDSAGYTLAMQMGIEFDRIQDGFDGPFEKLEGWFNPLPGKIEGAGTAGWLLDHRIKDSFTASNRLLKAGETVYWLTKNTRIRGRDLPPGTILIPAGSNTRTKIYSLTQDLGLNFTALSQLPSGEVHQLKPVKIGVWDRYGGSMQAGWVRWILEQFEFEYQTVYPQSLDAGNLKDRFDVLIFVAGGIPEVDSEDQNSSRGGPNPESIPEKFRFMLGSVTAEKTIPQLKSFIYQGGAVLTMGSSVSLAGHFDLPIMNSLTTLSEKGEVLALSSSEFSVPGSILQVRVNNADPLAYGMPDQVDVYFNRSPVFRLLPESSFENIAPVAWFDSEFPLRSGYARGQQHLYGGATVISAKIGEGHLFLFGPEITFRAQPHGTFPFLFNGILYGASKTTGLNP